MLEREPFARARGRPIDVRLRDVLPHCGVGESRAGKSHAASNAELLFVLGDLRREADAGEGGAGTHVGRVQDGDLAGGRVTLEVAA